MPHTLLGMTCFRKLSIIKLTFIPWNAGIALMSLLLWNIMVTLLKLLENIYCITCMWLTNAASRKCSLQKIILLHLLLLLLLFLNVNTKWKTMLLLWIFCKAASIEVLYTDILCFYRCFAVQSDWLRKNGDESLTRRQHHSLLWSLCNFWFPHCMVKKLHSCKSSLFFYKCQSFWIK